MALDWLTEVGNGVSVIRGMPNSPLVQYLSRHVYTTNRSATEHQQGLMATRGGWHQEKNGSKSNEESSRHKDNRENNGRKGHTENGYDMNLLAHQCSP